MKFRIGRDHPCLAGHFPDRPVVPGVVLLEQVAAAIEARRGAPLGACRMPQVKFVQPLLPDEEAEVRLENAAPRWRFRVLRRGTLIASGEVVVE